MENLVLQIESIKKLMNINESLLTESTVPADVWLKLSKYFDEIVIGGEKSLDNLVTNGRITKSDLQWLKSNAIDIARKAKSIIDPSSITDDVLKRFTRIIVKVPSNELRVLSKTAFNNWILKNPDKINPGLTLMDTLSNQLDLIRTGNIVQVVPGIKRAIDNGDTWESIFKFNLEKNGYKDELLGELLERFRNDVRFKNADDLTKIAKGEDIGEISEELYQKSIDALTKDIGPEKASWAVRTWSEKYPMIHKILDSKLGFDKSSVAYGDAVKSADDLVKLITDDINPDEITNLIIKLKNDMIQAQTKTQAFKDIWEEIKTLINNPDIVSKIESESGGDSFTSIKKYLEMEEELASKPSFKIIYKKLKNKTYNLIDTQNIKKSITEWGTMPKWKDVEVKSLRLANSIITRYIYGAIKWIFKTKLVRFLFWENFNSIKTILKGASKGNVRNFGFWKNVLFTYFKLLIVHHILTPLANFIEELYAKVRDIMGIGENVVTDKNIWERTLDASYNDIIKPWVNTFSDLDGQKIAKDLGLFFNPFGKGPLMDIAIDLFNWLKILTGGLSNEGKRKMEKEESDLEKELRNFFDENTKKALELVTLYDDADLQKIANFKSTILKDGTNYYELNATDISKLDTLTIVEGGSLYVMDVNSEKKFKIKQIKTDELKDRFSKITDDTKYQQYFWDDNGVQRSLKDLSSKLTINKKPKTTKDNVNGLSSNSGINDSIYKKTNNMLTEDNREKFGEDNFKHWKDTFTFKSQDDKNPGQYKDVKINMEDVMDRINHYRKKYDEDDSFVRAVIDTHEDVVKIMFTKDLANIHESATPRGLALLLRTIKESRGEMEIFSVARPANGNWFLVKGDYTPNQLANMDLEKKEPRTKETEVNSKSEDDLKKKEESAINVLKRNEKEGIEDLPKKVRDKVREKMGKGWTTETPPEELKEYFTTSEINSIFNDKIVIYKLEPTREFFNSLVKFSARIVTKRGFCRTLQSGKKEFELSERQKMTVNHILNKCNTKYESKLGLRNF